jgi:hypothetical protein
MLTSDTFKVTILHIQHELLNQSRDSTRSCNDEKRSCTPVSRICNVQVVVGCSAPVSLVIFLKNVSIRAAVVLGWNFILIYHSKPFLTILYYTPLHFHNSILYYTPHHTILPIFLLLPHGGRTAQHSTYRDTMTPLH